MLKLWRFQVCIPKIYFIRSALPIFLLIPPEFYFLPKVTRSHKHRTYFSKWSCVWCNHRHFIFVCFHFLYLEIAVQLTLTMSMCSENLICIEFHEKKNLSISSDFEYYLSSDENESWDLLLILLPCLFSKFYIKLVMKVIKLKIMSKWSKKCMLVLVWYNFHFCISTGRTMIRRKFRRMLSDPFTGVCFLSHPCYYHFKAMTTIHSKKKLFHHFLGLSILRISILSSEADASDE